jgi:hypothetical protein
MAEQSRPAGSHDWATRVVLVVTVGGAGLLLPWILVLSTELPVTPPGGAWRLAWVGYDAALAVALAATGALVWTRQRQAATSLVVSTVLVVTDAWFDTCLSWGTTGQTAAIVSALLIELPAALVLAWSAARLMRAPEAEVLPHDRAGHR